MPPYTVGTSKVANVTAAVAEIALTMEHRRQYKLYSSTDAWYRVVAPGAAGAAAAAKEADESHPIKAGTSVLVAATADRTRISIIRDTADGKATLSELRG